MPEYRRTLDYPHERACRRHAIRRAWERCGLALAMPDVKTIEGIIDAGRAVLIRSGETNRPVFKVPYRKLQLFVCYDLTLKSAVTFLTSAQAHRPYPGPKRKSRMT